MIYQIREYWAIIWASATTVVSLVLVLLSKTYAKKEELDKIRTRLNSTESILSQLPTQRELHQLQLDITKLRGEIRELVPEIKQVKRINDLLLDKELRD